MRKLLFGGALAAATALGGLAAPAAWAASGGTGHTVTSTQTVHGSLDPGVDTPNPCTGAAIISASAVGNSVMHVTFFPAGDEAWGTFTQTDKLTILDSNGVTLTGHQTVWGNFNTNNQNANNTFTLTVNLKGSDGSTITMHEVQHFAVNANGVVTVNFDKPNLSCG